MDDGGGVVTAWLAAPLLFVACFGGGAGVLSLCGAWHGRPLAERAGLAFAAGYGLLGWLGFWLGTAGWLLPGVLWPLCLVLAMGVWLFRAPPPVTGGSAWSWREWAMLGAGLMIVVLDAFEAAAPIVDADTLAYHLPIARDFAERGTIEFIPRAIDGAVPLLTQTVLAIALALSGGAEGAAAGWMMLSGWMAAVLLFGLARRWVSPFWALALALAFQTMPAMSYSAGVGHVEPRTAIFVLLAVAGLTDKDRCKGSLLAGLGAGLFVASKYTGLLFGGAALIALFASGARGWRAYAGLFLVAALAGGQWYAWNFIHTGDPVFPMFFGVAQQLGIATPGIWDQAHADLLTAARALRTAAVSGIEWYGLYPIAATLFPPPVLESGRVGMGPFVMLALPMALFAAWRARRRLAGHPLMPVAVLALAYYLIWMSAGMAPKVRHLLPAVPALVLVVGVAAHRYRPGRAALALAAGLSVAIGLLGQAVFAKLPIQYVLSKQTRAAFLERSVVGYPLVAPLNALPDGSHIYLWDRQIRGLLRHKTFFAGPQFQTLIDARQGYMEPDTFFRQITAQGITHIALRLSDHPRPKSHLSVLAALQSRGCVLPLQQVRYPRFQSRTLRTRQGERDYTAQIWSVRPDCRK